jgi:hypothetical protein
VERPKPTARLADVAPSAGAEKQANKIAAVRKTEAAKKPKPAAAAIQAAVNEISPKAKGRPDLPDAHPDCGRCGAIAEREASRMRRFREKKGKT